MSDERWSEVDVFARVMKRELDANADKGGWQNTGQWELLDHLEEEVRELRQVMASGKGWEAVLEEAADVANMAMMVADVYCELQTYEPSEPTSWIAWASRNGPTTKGHPLFDLSLTFLAFCLGALLSPLLWRWSARWFE